MSIDKSLKQSGGMLGTRNVLKRVERIGRSPLGLPKVRIKHAMTGKKKKKLEEEGTEAGAEAGTEAEEESATS